MNSFEWGFIIFQVIIATVCGYAVGHFSIYSEVNKKNSFLEEEYQSKKKK